MAYKYIQIDNKDYTRELIETARAQMKSGGLISKDEAKALVAIIAADGKYTKTEKATVAYIKAGGQDGEFKFAKGAEDYLDGALEAGEYKASFKKVKAAKKIAAKKAKRTHNTEKLDQDVLKLCVAANDSGNLITRNEIMAIVKQLKADGEYSDAERKTIAYARRHFAFTKAGKKLLTKHLRSWGGKRGADKGE